MARWTDLATWRGPTVNQVSGHAECRGLVIHIAQGSYEGTVSWCKNPASEISAHFITDNQSAAMAQMVDTDDTAWTQADGNGHWLSVENAGSVPTALTPAQVENVAQLFARGHLVYGYPLQLADSPAGYGLGHHAMGGQAWGGHLDCPGPNIIAQKPAILARATEIIAGPAPTIGGEMQVYTFGGLADCPPQLDGNQFVCTDGVGAYWVRALSSYQYGSTKLNGSAAVAVTLGKNVDGALPLGTSFELAFQQLTGGCVYDPTTTYGLASWRMPNSSGASPTDHTHGVTAHTGPAVPTAQ